jgi:hypothetical protein
VVAQPKIFHALEAVMSHLTLIDVVIPGALGLIQALVETGLECAQTSRFVSEDGKQHSVDLVVTDPETKTQVGVQIDAKTGKAQFIAHDCKSGGVKGKALAQRILQRYAYAKVREELRRKGYQLGKEQVRPDGTIQLSAQRWK